MIVFHNEKINGEIVENNENPVILKTCYQNEADAIPDIKALCSLLFKAGESAYLDSGDTSTKCKYVSYWLEQLEKDEVYIQEKISINPIIEHRCDANVTAYRTILVEIDPDLKPDASAAVRAEAVKEQIRYIQSIGMPYSAAIYTGNKSIHWLITLEQDLPNAKEYRALVDRIYDAVGLSSKGKMLADLQCKNESKATRLPGYQHKQIDGKEKNRRAGQWQVLQEIHQPIALADLEAWIASRPVIERPKANKDNLVDIDFDFCASISDAALAKKLNLLPNRSKNLLVNGGSMVDGERRSAFWETSCDFYEVGIPLDDAQEILIPIGIECGFQEADAFKIGAQIEGAYLYKEEKGVPAAVAQSIAKKKSDADYEESLELLEEIIPAPAAKAPPEATETPKAADPDLLAGLSESDKQWAAWGIAEGKAREKKEAEAKLQAEEKRKRGFFLSELANRPKGKQLIKGHIFERSFCIMFGDWGTYKTFFAIDIVQHICHGLPLFGKHEVKQGACVYICSEGANSFGERLKAWNDYHGVEDKNNCLIIPYSFDIAEEYPLIIQLVKEKLKEDPKMVVIDTVARNLNGDESDCQDMKAFTKGCEEIQNQLNTTILCVHHSGKDASKGPRGHSSFPGAADTIIEVKRPNKAESKAYFCCYKPKDLEAFETQVVNAKSISLGLDEDYNPVSSLVLVPMEEKPETKIEVAEKISAHLFNLLPVIDVGTEPTVNNTVSINDLIPKYHFPKDCKDHKEQYKHLHKKLTEEKQGENLHNVCQYDFNKRVYWYVKPTVNRPI